MTRVSRFRFGHRAEGVFCRLGFELAGSECGILNVRRKAKRRRRRRS